MKKRYIRPLSFCLKIKTNILKCPVPVILMVFLDSTGIRQTEKRPRLKVMAVKYLYRLNDMNSTASAKFLIGSLTVPVILMVMVMLVSGLQIFWRGKSIGSGFLDGFLSIFSCKIPNVGL